MPKTFKDIITGEEIGLPVMTAAVNRKYRTTLIRDWHCHDHDEFHYLLSGSQTYEIGNRRPRKVTLTGGRFLHLATGVRHQVVGDDGTPSTRLTVGWRTDGPAHFDYSPFSERETAELQRSLARIPQGPNLMSAELIHAVKHLRALMGSGSEGVSLRLAGWNLFLATSHCTSVSAGGDPRSMDELADYLAANHADKISMRELARKFGWSRRNLFLLCKRHFGVTPTQLLMRERIDAAQRLLLSSPERSVVDIALECGFCSASHFTATFRQYTGTTPRRWRHASDQRQQVQANG